MIELFSATKGLWFLLLMAGLIVGGVIGVFYGGFALLFNLVREIIGFRVLLVIIGIAALLIWSTY